MSNDIAARFHAAMSSPGVKTAATALRSALEDSSSTESFHVETLHGERLAALFDGCIQRVGRAAQAGLEVPCEPRGDAVSNIPLEQVAGSVRPKFGAYGGGASQSELDYVVRNAPVAMRRADDCIAINARWLQQKST